MANPPLGTPDETLQHAKALQWKRVIRAETFPRVDGVKRAAGSAAAALHSVNSNTQPTTSIVTVGTRIVTLGLAAANEAASAFTLTKSSVVIAIAAALAVKCS